MKEYIGVDKLENDTYNALNDLEYYIKSINDQIKTKKDEKLKLEVELNLLKGHKDELEAIRSGLSVSLSDYKKYKDSIKVSEGSVPTDEK